MRAGQVIWKASMLVQVVMSVIPDVLQNHVSFSRYLRICFAALRSCILTQMRPLHNPQLASFPYLLNLLLCVNMI
jgi:hypothetical protein